MKPQAMTLAAVSLALALALALAACGPSDPGAERAGLIAERQAAADRADAAPGDRNENLACAAKRVSAATVEAHLTTMINERPDLVSGSARRAASNDMLTQIEACGGDIESAVAELERSGDALFYAYAYAMLEAGRGLS